MSTCKRKNRLRKKKGRGMSVDNRLYGPLVTEEKEEEEEEMKNLCCARHEGDK